jgi:GH35 family endo-1,4-beta-xylanase
MDTNFFNSLLWRRLARITDRMVAWAQENDIQLRGHCVFWEDTQTVQPWVRALDNTGLKAALDTRLNQVRSHVSL